jgi:hydrogenase maturation protease
VLPQHAILIDGGIAGLETILLMQDHQRAIIVDAAEMGCLPGEWVRFTCEDVMLKPADPALRSTLHSAGLAESLALGEALGILPEEIIVYGIQPRSIGWLPGLSEPLRAVIPAVCSAILGEIGCSSPYDVS